MTTVPGTPAATLAAYADAGPLARLADRAEHHGGAQAFGLTVLGAVPLTVALALLDPDLFDRLLLVAAVAVFVLAASLGWAASLDDRFDWLVPALLRAVEYGVVIRVTAVLAPGDMPAAYAFCAALAYHHYDVINRVRYTGLAPATWVAYAGGGFDGRMLVLAVLALGGAATLTAGLWLAAAGLAVVFVSESVRAWLSWTRNADAPVDSAKEDVD
ncbi:MAG: DUF5941 domain-containing protein [Actinomycetes bacterium]